MSALESLKERIMKAVSDHVNLPIAESLAAVRHVAVMEVQKTFKECGVYEEVKDENPGKYVVIATDSNDQTQINVIFSDHLKKLLKDK